MFERLTTSKNIARQSFFVYVKQKMFWKFSKTSRHEFCYCCFSSCQSMFDRLAAFPTLFFKHFFYCWKTATTCSISVSSNISQQQGVPASALAMNLLFRNVGQQCFWTWPNNQTLFVKRIQNVWLIVFDRLARALRYFDDEDVTGVTERHRQIYSQKVLTSASICFFSFWLCSFVVFDLCMCVWTFCKTPSQFAHLKWWKFDLN